MKQGVFVVTGKSRLTGEREEVSPRGSLEVMRNALQVMKRKQKRAAAFSELRVEAVEMKIWT